MNLQWHGQLQLSGLVTSVSEETIKGQVRNVLSKLGANDRTHAAIDWCRPGHG